MLIAFLATLLSILITVPQTPIYQARTSIEIQDLNQDFMNMKQVSPINEGANWNVLTDIQTQIKILQSETLLDRAAAKIPPLPNALPERVESWRKMLNLPELEPKKAWEGTLKSLKNSLKVRAAGQTRIIEATVDSPDPALAASFANTLINEFIEQNMEARWQMSQRTGDWLGRQLEEMRVKLERSEDALQTYARQAGLVFTGEQRQNVADDRLRQLQEELSKAQADRVSKQSRYELAARASAETLPDVLNDASLRGYQEKLTDLRRQEAELIATYKPEYAKVKRVQVQITTVNEALERERRAIVQRIRNEFEEAQSREKLLSADYAAQTRIVTDQAGRAIQYNILKREVDTNRGLYESMLQRVKEASIASAMKASNVRVVDAARAPERPYKPKLPLNGALGLMAGLFLGVAFVVMRERADRTIQEPGDAAFWLNIPELGVIPAGENAHKKRYYLSYRSKEREAKITSLTVPANNRVELVTTQHKHSIVAEAFRATLTSILFSSVNGNGARPKVVVITSANPTEGKTTVAANLACALAEVGQRVLLIDADMRKPRMHDIFEVSNDAGLSTILEGGVLDPETTPGLFIETRSPGLFVLPSGPHPSAPANLLFSPVMGKLLEHVEKEFDMVLLDTPPMLQMPDARVLGRLADGVILVLRGGKTTRDAALAARTRLAEDKIKILGSILNDWDPKGGGGYYYNGSSGYSRYSAYQDSKH